MYLGGNSKYKNRSIHDLICIIQPEENKRQSCLIQSKEQYTFPRNSEQRLQEKAKIEKKDMIAAE